MCSAGLPAGCGVGVPARTCFPVVTRSLSLIYSSRMKLTYVIRFLLAIAFGVLFGQHVQRDYEKWHALGRDAYLSYQGRRFDTHMAQPSPGVYQIVAATILVAGLVALYEMAAFFLEKFWLSTGRAQTSTTPNS